MLCPRPCGRIAAGGVKPGQLPPKTVSVHVGKRSRPSGLTVDWSEDEKERQSRGGVNLEVPGVHGRERVQLGLVVW